MGFFKRKTNAPLSTSMYQGDNATPASSPPRRGGLPLTADPALDTPIAATATEAATAGTKSTGGTAATKKKKKIPKGFFKRRNNNQSYVTITPDKNEDGSSIDAGYTPQTRSQRGTTTASSTTPSMSFRVASSSFQGTPPPTRSRGNANNHRDDVPALVTPGKYDDSPRSSHDEIKRNLNLAFHESDDDKDEDEDDRIHINDDDNDVAAEENKKFLQRICASWKKSPGKGRKKQDLIRLIQENNSRTTSSNEGTDPSPPPAVPETIDHSDERSINSLITEPEEIQKMIAESPERTAAVMSTVEESPLSAPRTATYAARAPGPSGHVVAPSREKFPSGPSLLRALTLGERFLSLLQCGEDTTSDGYFGRIKCSYLCSPGSGAKNGLRERRMDEDDRLVTPFSHMLKMGIPLGEVEQAPQKEGKDKCIASMDPEKLYASQIKDKTPNKADVSLKDDPEYAKFFKMQRMGIPIPAVKQALQKEGKDPSIIDMDPEKPYARQIKDKAPIIADVPLKDDPEYAKFFKMQRMGIPIPAVKQALQKEGKDPNIIDMDPEKPLSQQHNNSKAVQNPKNIAPKVARKRLHWNKIDESKLNEKSFWNQAKEEHASLQLVGLDIDNDEFSSLFTSPVNKSAAPKKENAPKKPPGKQKVQLIDGRRRMNGSILLTKFKVDYKLIAKQVDRMEYIEAEGNELRGMMQLLPTKDESLALRSYLPPADAPKAEIDEAISKLGECEQYMAVMLDVPDAKEKLQCMLFRAEFEQQVDSIRDGTKLLIDACNSVQNSERFKKLLMYSLKLGNALNTGGSGKEVNAITLDSLLKLAEAKAFDRQTSVLHYLVSIVSKNDEDVLRLSEDFGPVKAAERVAVDMISQQLRELSNGIKLIKKMAKKYSPNQDMAGEKTHDATPEDELLWATSMGKFCLSAESIIKSLTNEFDRAKTSFADLLDFFGEDASLTPKAFFCTINTFLSMFDQTYKELKRKEESKERKKRIEEKRKLREEEVEGNSPTED